MSQSSNHDDAEAGASESAGIASKYWRELSGRLRYVPHFENASQPQDIISGLNNVVSEVERLNKKLGVYEILMEQKDQEIKEKDDNIEKLRKRNQDLTVMLQQQLEDGKEARPPVVGLQTSVVENENVDLEKKYKNLARDREELYVHWKTVTQDRDGYKEKFEDAEAKCSFLKEEMEVLQRGQYEGKRSNTAVGDKEVVLQRDEEGRCGIRFGCPKRTPLLMESNTIVIDVKPGLPNSSQLCIGDFVIEVNGCNTQWMTLQEVLELLKINPSGDLKLKLRPSRKHMAQTTKIFGGHLSDWGLSLGVYVKETKTGSFSDTTGIHEMDQVLMVNSEDVQKLSLRNIYKLMGKEVKFKMQRLENPYQLHEQSSTPSSFASHEQSTRPSSIVSNESVRSKETPQVRRNKPPRRVASLPKDDASDISSSKSNHSDDAGNISPSPFSDKSDNISPQNSTGRLSPQSSIDVPVIMAIDRECVICDVTKNDFQPFGWSLIGGNKIGIYVKSVENWSPIQTAGIEVGWKILQINNTSLENVGFSFAMDFIGSLRHSVCINVKLEKTSHIYSAEISKKPYDTFHIRAVRDYKKKSSYESSFKAGEVFCVIDSYYLNENSTVSWEARGTASTSSQRVKIPIQKANFIVTEEEKNSTYQKKNVPVRYYEILDDVDIKGEKESESFDA